MTLKEMIDRRFAMVNGFFMKTGEELWEATLRDHRGGDYGPYDELRQQLDIKDNLLLGRKWYRFKTRGDVKPGKTKCIFYFHGGGWILETGPQQLNFAGWLADHSGAEVWFPEYPLAPEANCVDAQNMFTALYKLMLKEFAADEIAFMGDSAGGGLVVSAAMYFRDHDLPQPNNLILISPGVDLIITRTPEEEAYNQILIDNKLNCLDTKSQPTVQEWWRGPLKETDYLVNPTCGDLRGLAPMTIFVGSAENIGAMKFAAKAAKQRVPVKYWEKLNAVHTWVTREGEDNQAERELILDLLKNPND